MKYLILTILGLSVLSGSLAYASLSPLDASPNIPSLCKISNTTHVLSCAGIEDTFNMTGSNGIRVKLDNTTKTITIVGVTPNTSQGTYNQTYANNALINSGGHRLNFINGTNSTISLVNDPSRNQINITISSTGGGGGGSGVSSVNALSGALTIACVAGNTTCTTSGGNTITINTAYNIATLNLNEIFSGITTMNNLKLGGQMNINGQTMQSFGHVYSWQNHTGTVCLTNQTTSCGPAGSATYDTLVNIGTGEASVYAGNTTKTNFDFKTLKQGSHITLTNNTNDVTISATGLLSNALLSINNDTTSAQTLKVIGSGSIADNGGGIHTITTKTYQNNTGGNLGTHGIGPFASMNAQVLQFLSLVSANSNCAFTNNSTNLILTCSTPPSITSVNSQTGPSITITRQPSYTTITNSTNNIKVGIDAAGVMELNGTQTVTGTKTHSADLIMSGANINLGTNGLTNSGHKSTLPLTSGTLCQTNQSSTCGINSGVTSITGTAHNVTASSSTGAVTLNTGDNVFITNGSTQNITKATIMNGGLTMSHSNISLSGNRLTTTNYEIFDPNVNNGRGLKYLQINNTLGANTPGIVDIFPSNPNLSSWFEFNRLQPPATTNYEVLRVGTDTKVAGEYEIQADWGGTGVARPINVYMGLTQLLSWDTGNTITSYVNTLFKTKITQYNSINTSGMGIQPIYSATSQKSESGADANVVTYTPPATAGNYEIKITMSVSAASSATFGWTASWKDSNGHAQAPTNLSLTKSGTAAPALTFTAAANDVYYAVLPIDTDNSATNIIVKTTFAGTSIAYKVSATIEQVQ